MTLAGTQPEPAQDERALEPGAMQFTRQRLLPSGHLVEFESAPAGWLKRDGDARKVDWRSYYLTGPADGKRCRVESVTTMLDRIMPKPGLPPWSEKAGILGAREAVNQGLVFGHDSEQHWVDTVRSRKLGADALRDRAADRGLNVHAILERYMLTGEFDNPADHPAPHRPFIKGLARALARFDLEPVAVEMLVAHPEHGYAGRLDLLAYRGRRLTLVDLKTQERGAIYESAHVQVCLYAEAEREFGEHDIDDGLIVVVDGHGGFNEMDAGLDSQLAADALAFYRRVKPLYSACESRNRIVKQTLAEAVA